MTPSNATALLHVLGFLTASALYVMLAVMTLGERHGGPAEPYPGRTDLIPLATALLGLVWNVGELVMYGLHATAASPPPWLVVVAFAALSYLPAVVVHSALAGSASLRSGTHPSPGRAIVVAGYGLSTLATALNTVGALHGDPLPTRESLLVLSVGFVIVVALLTLYSRRQPTWRRALPAVAVATFAVMVVHLTQHSAGTDPWAAELIGHHGSLLVVLVILYQDYRFALADLFLKRALTLLALTGLAVALYAGVVVPLILPHLAETGTEGRTNAPVAAAALLALWVGTAIAYPWLRRSVARFVDRTVLGRPDTGRLLADLAQETSTFTTVDQVLDAACGALAPALSATRTSWLAEPERPDAPAGQAPGVTARSLIAVTPGARETSVRIPTADPPAYRITIGGLSGGRRLMSDDLALLEGVARLAARRIDALRVAHERYERDVREQQIMRLATESELRALHAQLNPHFLFNALTTIGYLVREAPDRALDTMYRLTDVLRGVLKRSDGEFTTLGDEMEIVCAYLAIERARFEDRLNVTTDVAPELTGLRIPPLLLQPLVENAVKHGIAPLARGGRIIIAARTEEVAHPTRRNGEGAEPPGVRLWLTVTDTGMGTAPAELEARRRAGIGLANIERRLERHFGDAASLRIRSAVGVGTTVEVRLPAIT